MKRLLTSFFVLTTLLLLNFPAFSQGNVGIGTTTPAEKLDINGALIIRGDAVMAVPVAGTIRWNATDGKHDGRTSTGIWRRLENDYSLVSGTYYTVGCGAALTTTVGAGVSTSIGAYDTPFGTQYTDARKQFLYSAAELTTAGYCIGNITSIGFTIITLGTSTINNFTIKMKNSATATFPAPLAVGCTTWETGVTIVYPAATVTLVAGLNTFTLGTPHFWDGTSNLLIEICFDNTAIGVGTNSSVSTLNSGLYKNRYYYASLPFTSGCSITSAISTTITRPNIMLTGITYGPVGTTTNYIKFNQPWVAGSPVLPVPYEHHGPGSVTGKAIYDDNTLLSDYVFDKYFDGEVRDEDLNKHSDYKMASLTEMVDFMETYRHLPTISGRDEWEKNGTFSVGELSTWLWETSETQALYLIELKQRLDTLKTTAEPLKNR